MSPLL
ncbi:Protein of unknown function [Propionibacterium freudenreichii]|jgi:hypothetical protein